MSEERIDGVCIIKSFQMNSFSRMEVQELKVDGVKKLTKCLDVNMKALSEIGFRLD